MLCCFGHISCGRTSFVHRRSRFPATVSCRVTQCHAALPRVFRKQLSDLSNVLAEMEAAMPSVVSKARLPRARLDMGKSWKELRCTLYRVKNPLRCQLLVGQIKYVLVVWLQNSSKRSICTGQLLCQAVDAVRQAERLASQWQKRAEQLRRQKKKSRRHKKMTHA